MADPKPEQILKEYEQALKALKAIKVDPKKAGQLSKDVKALESGWKDDKD